VQRKRAMVGCGAFAGGDGTTDLPPPQEA